MIRSIYRYLQPIVNKLYLFLRKAEIVLLCNFTRNIICEHVDSLSLKNLTVRIWDAELKILQHHNAINNFNHMNTENVKATGTEVVLEIKKFSFLAVSKNHFIRYGLTKG